MDRGDALSFAEVSFDPCLPLSSFFSPSVPLSWWCRLRFEGCSCDRCWSATDISAVPFRTSSTCVSLFVSESLSSLERLCSILLEAEVTL